jgi:diguanylate cyclase (GGDEF)-like protein
MMTGYDNQGRRSLRVAILIGLSAILMAIVATAWFSIHQARQLEFISWNQSFYRDLVECRASLTALDQCLGKPSLSVREQGEIQARFQLERARFVGAGRRSAIRQGGMLDDWIAGSGPFRGTVSRASIGMVLTELDAMIPSTSKKIDDGIGAIKAGLQYYLVFMILLISAVVLAGGRMLVSNYHHLLLPLNELAARLAQLNRDLPESVHETAEATSSILSDDSPTPQIRYVTESVSGLCREIEEKNRKLDELFIMDEKTNLYNYRHFKEHLVVDVERARRFGDCISLAMIDIDHFKSYNDAYGHIAGDRVLARIAAIIREECRVTDIPARFGGEEFAILFPKSDREMSVDIAERLRQIIEAEPFDHERRQPEGALTVSIGLATWPDDADDWYSLINHADQALYAAKNFGRNRVLAFFPEMAEEKVPV